MHSFAFPDKKSPSESEGLLKGNLTVEPQKIIDGNLMKFCKGNQNGAWNIQNTAFITGISGLRKIEHFCHLFLGQISIFPKIPNSLIHHSSPYQ